MGRLLKRIRLNDLIKKIGHTYKYRITETGRRLLLTVLKLCEYTFQLRASRLGFSCTSRIQMSS